MTPPVVHVHVQLGGMGHIASDPVLMDIGDKLAAARATVETTAAIATM